MFSAVSMAPAPSPRGMAHRHIAGRLPEKENPGYRIAFGIQLAVTALLAVTLPVWGKVHPVTEAGAQEQAKDLRLGEIARIPGVKLMWTLFIASCAIECTCGNWASTFLVEVRHMAAEQAAGLVMLYYAGMALE